MRLWSLHPSYLDARGLVALWREGLLAKAVLEGRTTGYRHHPQLARFRAAPDPVAAINAYLWGVLDDAEACGYRFDRSKLALRRAVPPLPVTEGQLAYEWAHLLRKLEMRDPDRWRAWQDEVPIRPHPLFVVVPGEVADWERL